VSRRGALLSCAVVLLCGASLALGRSAYLGAKAVVAGVLVDRALAANLADGETHPPWSWADTAPIAEVEVGEGGVRRAILSGASGSSLAFGLGHLDGTALPGERGTCAVLGHRDTWARFLRDVRLGTTVRVRTHRGITEYRVTSIRVVPATDGGVLGEVAGRRLALITCYPFSGLLRSPWRYVVTCDAIHRGAEIGARRAKQPGRSARRLHEPRGPDPGIRMPGGECAAYSRQGRGLTSPVGRSRATTAGRGGDPGRAGARTLAASSIPTW